MDQLKSQSLIYMHHYEGWPTQSLGVFELSWRVVERSDLDLKGRTGVSWCSLEATTSDFMKMECAIFVRVVDVPRSVSKAN